jgi:hypothetical protein
MITEARAQVDLIAALHLEDSFKIGYLGSARGLSIKTSMARTASNASSRAAANIAVWRTYLSEDCVAAMINDGWHFST